MISKVGNSAAVAAAALDRRTAVSANDTRCTIVIPPFGCVNGSARFSFATKARATASPDGAIGNKFSAWPDRATVTCLLVCKARD